MDPNWDTCSYCEAEQKSNQRSTSVQNPDPFERQRTVVGSPKPNPPEPQRVTRERRRPLARRSRRVRRHAPADRDAGHIYVASEGEYFPVREGKTFIGNGDVSSEAFHRRCDVHLPHDETMSAEHALILCRQGNYEILDQISSNGTFLGGQMPKANQGTELPNYAQIKTGSTLWIFIMVNPPANRRSSPGPARRSSLRCRHPRRRIRLVVR